MRNNQSYNGSELHRLKPMREYDPQVFQRLYKVCKPVIRNLTFQIDAKRFDLTPDIIASYFWDKMLFVFNKYYGTCTEEHLKARILLSLSTYKCNLLRRYAYSEKAQYYQNQFSLDTVFENDRELVDSSEEEKAQSEMWDMLQDYMNKNLSEDAKLVWEVLTTPPPYIKERVKEGSRITNILLVDFFGMKKTKSSVKYLSELREDIQYWLKRASKELHY